MITITEEVSTQILAIKRLNESQYRNLDITATLEYFNKRFVQPIAQRFDISNTSIIDCGAGFGWFSFAYLLAGGRQAIAADLDKTRIEAAKSIAGILNLDEQMQFICAAVQDINLPNNAVDVFVSIETLEHVGKSNIKPALENVKRIAGKGILITTPNKFFPVIAHDTQLPFIHWITPNARKPLTRLFHREKLDQGNEFLSPIDLNIFLDKFHPDTSCLTFRNYPEYLAHFPIYLPYGSNESARWQAKPSARKMAYYRLASYLFKNNAYWIMPSLTTLFLANQGR